MTRRLLKTTPRASHRTITVSYADGRDERFALHRFDSGDVCWRLDEFQMPTIRASSERGSTRTAG